MPKFKTNRLWNCVSSELSWVEVSRLFLDHGTRAEVSRITFLVSKCLEVGAEVSQSVLMPMCPVAILYADSDFDVATSFRDRRVEVREEFRHRLARFGEKV